MSLYRRDFHETKYIHVFLITDDELLEKYNEIWEKVSNMGNSAKMFTIIKYQPKLLNIFVHQ